MTYFSNLALGFQIVYRKSKKPDFLIGKIDYSAHILHSAKYFTQQTDSLLQEFCCLKKSALTFGT